MDNLPLLVTIAVVSYLSGSVPFGLIVARLSHDIDLRDHGSGNTGATNTLRVLGWKLSFLVAVADVGKGVLAVLLARFLVGDVNAEVVAGLAVLLGHNWPLYVAFRGGRGVATAFGALAVISPLGAVAVAVAFAVSIAISRYVSLGSIMAGVVAIIAGLGLAISGALQPGYLSFILVAAAIVILRHRDNIDRLLAGRERKLGQ